MGTSIHYTAERPSPLSEVERADVDRIVAEQNEGFPFDYEVLYFYEADVEQPEVLLDGSTKITMEASEMLPSIAYWCVALTQLRRALPSAQWTVHLDGIEIPWTGDNGYQLSGLDEMDGLDALIGE